MSLSGGVGGAQQNLIEHRREAQRVRRVARCENNEIISPRQRFQEHREICALRLSRDRFGAGSGHNEMQARGGVALNDVAEIGDAGEEIAQTFRPRLPARGELVENRIREIHGDQNGATALRESARQREHRGGGRRAGVAAREKHLDARRAARLR